MHDAVGDRWRSWHRAFILWQELFLFYFPEQELKLQGFFILTNRYFYMKPEQYRAETGGE